MKKKRPHVDTTVPTVPASERDIMRALLMTPPPKATSIEDLDAALQRAAKTRKRRAMAVKKRKTKKRKER